MLLSEPTSCKSVFKSSILLFVSSWRLEMLIVLVTIDVVSVFDVEETDISSSYSIATYHPQRWHIRRKPMEEKRSFVSPIKMKMASPQLK